MRIDVRGERRASKQRFVPALTAVLVVSLASSTSTATPVATTKQQREVLGRTFLEPRDSADYIQFGRDPSGVSEFEDGMQLLERIYPRYLELTTVAKELDSRYAVSTGPDGLRPWDKGDSGDGNPLHVAVLTDERVPDERKEYAAFTFAHAWEACGREGLIRSIEDMLIWAKDDPDHVLQNRSGLTGDRTKMSVREVLRKTKIYLVSVNPDGWQSGDRKAGQYSQNTGSGFNGNRLTYQTGWVFPAKMTYEASGFSTLTEPEGAAVTKYLRRVRMTELDGRPFTIGADIHGPIPFGMILLHDQSNNPEKLLRIQDLGARVEQAMEGTQGRYITGPGSRAYETAMSTIDSTTWDQRRTVLPLNLPLQWASYGHIFDLIWKTAGASWGGWMNSDSGLGADAITFEMTCRAGQWDPSEQQVFQDTVRSIFRTMVVTAAARQETPRFGVDVDSRVGFYEHGERVTDRDGNPSPAPLGYPGHPLIRHIHQRAYNVSNTDYFRDLRGLLPERVVEVRDPIESLGDLDSFVISDATVEDVDAVESFVRSGGNLVLTDRALNMLPSLLGISHERLNVRLRQGYVGYADLKRRHWLTKGLPHHAKQTYDPIGIGYPTLMERDDYWWMYSDADSGTKNSAPIWTIRRSAWERAGGVTVGTADPPAKGEGRQEGSETDETTIGVAEVGDGRIVIFGGLLPRPTEKYSHWFGLEGYSISTTGQTMLLRALED